MENWKEAANDLLEDLSEKQAEIEADMADLEHAIMTDSKKLAMDIMENWEGS